MCRLLGYFVIIPTQVLLGQNDKSTLCRKLGYFDEVLYGVKCDRIINLSMSPIRLF